MMLDLETITRAEVLKRVDAAIAAKDVVAVPAAQFRRLLLTAFPLDRPKDREAVKTQRGECVMEVRG